MDIFIAKETKAGENSDYVFYTNSFTEELTRYAAEDNLESGFKGLVGVYALFARNKTNRNGNYILCKKGHVIGECSSFEAACCRIDVLKMVMKI